MSIMQMLLAKISEIVRAWDIKYAFFDGASPSFVNVRTEQPNINGGVFKPDGTKMFIIGDATGRKVDEYELSNPWDVSTASHVQSYSTQSEDLTPEDIFFRNDGSADDGKQMYIVADSGNEVNEYSLTTAWDISTASYSRRLSITNEESNPLGIFFRDDGEKMYICGRNGDEVNEYTLTTAWNVTTAQHVQAFSVSSQENNASGVFFRNDGSSNDGKQMYIVGYSGDDVNEYSLTTAWDISTASYVRNFSVNNLDTAPMGLFFKSDGSEMFIFGQTTKTVYKFYLDTPWNVSSTTYYTPFTNYVSVGDRESQPAGLFFKPDGSEMFVLGRGANDVLKYNLQINWQIETAKFSQEFAVGTQETVSRGLVFRDDNTANAGKQMYVIGTQGDDVNEYSLTTAWDLSTASFTHSFSVQTEAGQPQAVAFKSDGSKMFVLNSNDRKVYSYSLSADWDVSSASYDGSTTDLSVQSQDLAPQGMFFKNDGKKMYMCGFSGKDINQYSLQNAWEPASATYERNFSVASTGGDPNGIFFKPDGNRFFIADENTDSIAAYDLDPTPPIWNNISNATSLRNDAINLNGRNQGGIFFRPDGKKLYHVSNSGLNDYTITEQTLNTAWDISTHTSVTHTFNPPTATGGSYSYSHAQNMFIKPDGLMLFYADADTDKVIAHTLSTPWDLSSINTSSSAELQIGSEGTLKGIYFSPDGTKLFVHGFTTDLIRRYTLSTAWDITTATAHSTGACGDVPLGLWFKKDGTRMYVTDNQHDAIRQWNLTTAWDISGVTKTNYSDEFDLSTIDLIPQDLFIDDTGTFLYVCGGETDKVYQFTL